MTVVADITITKKHLKVADMADSGKDGTASDASDV